MSLFAHTIIFSAVLSQADGALNPQRFCGFHKTCKSQMGSLFKASNGGQVAQQSRGCVTTVAHEQGLTDSPLHLFFPLPKLQSSTAGAK